MIDPVKPEIAKLAEMIGSFSVVPFVGAGCSKDQLQGYDWSGITNATAGELGITSWTDPTDVAEEFVKRFGREKLYEFLQPKLSITDFDDSKGEAHLALLAMNFPYIYTTNVDNVFEICHEKYGRQLTNVTALNDLHGIIPGKTVLYKYHGSIDTFDSIVWTKSDYERRLNDEQFFLNVRLRSELLSKTLLFIGYGLGDAHITELLASMQRLYSDGMRKSIVVALGDVSKFRARVADAGLAVDIIAPQELFPVLEPHVALGRFLSETSAEVQRLHVNSSLADLFKKAKPSPSRVLTDYELKLLESKLTEVTLDEAINMARASLDRAVIPHDFYDRVVTYSCGLFTRAHAEACDYNNLGGFLGNLHLRPDSKILIWAYSCSLFVKDDVDWSKDFLLMSDLPDVAGAKSVIACEASKVLLALGKPLNGRFADWVAGPLQIDKDDLAALPPEVQPSINSQFATIFIGSQRDNPLLIQRPRFSAFKRLNKTEMLNQMLSNLPKHIHKPFEG